MHWLVLNISYYPKMKMDGATGRMSTGQFIPMELQQENKCCGVAATKKIRAVCNGRKPFSFANLVQGRRIM